MLSIGKQYIQMYLPIQTQKKNTHTELKSKTGQGRSQKGSKPRRQRQIKRVCTSYRFQRVRTINTPFCKATGENTYWYHANCPKCNNTPR